MERLSRSLSRHFAGAPLILALALMMVSISPVEAAWRAASVDEITHESCARQVYQGLVWGAKPGFCDQGLFPLPASASLKCNLYRETGYPSSLMKKACQLFDRGLIEFFIEGAESQQ